ncbi:MAG: LacI family DNA-binding transcriptional regulator [Planctomycetes bacterium]|nr:LacI family DNA-binding transcriptional regulator [Planctomycetota bacterium]
MTRLKDIAEVAGVSIRTVGRALKGEGYVEAGVRERVLGAARSLDYRPHRLARSLRTGRSQEVLVLAGGIGGQYDELHIAKIAGMERTLRAAGMSLGLLFGIESEARRAGRDVLDELIARRPAGLALFASATLPATATARRLVQARVPYVFFDTREPDVDTVRHDRSGGVREAVRWLAGRGHRRIAYIGSIEERSRLDGYHEALKALGREPLIVDCEAEYNAARAAAATLMALKPDAVQVYSDILALGLLAGLHELGVRVPQDLAVVGFDDRFAASLSYPPLTTLQQSNEAMGAAAAAILIAKSRDETAPPGGWTRTLPMSLVIRAST